MSAASAPSTARWSVFRWWSASNNDGCAIARSAEAKALGVKMGDPIHLIRDKLKQHGIRWLSSNYTLYGDMHRRVTAAVQEFARDVEVYSIDESFLDLAGFETRNLEAHARAMREQVRRWTTIPTCVGIAGTKTLAKLANATAKKQPGYDGVADLRDDRLRREVMEAFPASDVWGIGRATAAKLEALGVTTAAELAAMPMKQARAVGTVVLERLVAELRNVPAGAVETVEPQRKGMAVTRSFGKPVGDLDVMMGAVAQYAMRAGEKLRQHGAGGRAADGVLPHVPAPARPAAAQRLGRLRAVAHDIGRAGAAGGGPPAGGGALGAGRAVRLHQSRSDVGRSPGGA